MKNEIFNGDTIHDGLSQDNPIKPKRESAGSGGMSICQLCGNSTVENITDTRE